MTTENTVVLSATDKVKAALKKVEAAKKKANAVEGQLEKALAAARQRFAEKQVAANADVEAAKKELDAAVYELKNGEPAPEYYGELDSAEAV